MHIFQTFQYFATTHSMIGMSFSFMRFTSNSFGIITNILINWIGCRIVLFIGGALHCLGLLASTLAPDPKWFCVSLTLFGIGNNMVYNSSTLIIPQYFDKVQPQLPIYFSTKYLTKMISEKINSYWSDSSWKCSWSHGPTTIYCLGRRVL